MDASINQSIKGNLTSVSSSGDDIRDVSDGDLQDHITNCHLIVDQLNSHDRTLCMQMFIRSSRALSMNYGFEFLVPLSILSIIMTIEYCYTVILLFKNKEYPKMNSIKYISQSWQ